MSELPELTKLFRSAWARNDEAPESVMLHECTENHKGVRALFLNTLYFPDFGTAYFKGIEAERIAGTALQKSGAFGIAEAAEFSTTPEYLLDDSTGRITVWVNVAVPRGGEEAWNRVLREAREERDLLKEARKTENKDLLRYIAAKDALRRRGRLTSFKTANLSMSQGESVVTDLLRRLNIR